MLEKLRCGAFSSEQCDSLRYRKQAISESFDIVLILVYFIRVDSRVYLLCLDLNNTNTRIYANQKKTLEQDIVASLLIAPPLVRNTIVLLLG